MSVVHGGKGEEERGEGPLRRQRLSAMATSLCEREEDSFAATIAARWVCSQGHRSRAGAPMAGREAQGQGAARLAIVAEDPGAILVGTKDGVSVVVTPWSLPFSLVLIRFINHLKNIFCLTKSKSLFNNARNNRNCHGELFFLNSSCSNPLTGFP